MTSRCTKYVIGLVALVILTLGGDNCAAQELGMRPKEERKVRTELGIGAGATYTGFYSGTNEGIALRPLIGIGAHFDFALLFGNNFAIETEIGYGGGSIDVSNVRLERRVRTRAVDIPLLLSARLVNHRVRISAGAMFTVLSSAEYTLNSEKMLFGPIHPTVSLAGGVGIGISKFTIIEVRYIHPLKETLNQFDGMEFHTKAYRITLGLALNF